MAADRARVEGLVRGSTGSWDGWCSLRIHHSAWSVGMAPVQLDVIEKIVNAANEAFDNPFQRKRLIDLVVEEHEGYALPPGLEEEVRMLAASIAEAQAGES